MKIAHGFILVLLLNAASVFAQSGQPEANPTQNTFENIGSELTKISKSVQTLNQRMKDFLDKFGALGSTNLSEKQQKLLLAFEVLNRAEQRLATLQKFQIELVEKQVSVKTRLVQTEQEIKPESIERSVTFVGTTKTEEIRENRRRTLEVERGSLQTLLSQIQGTLSQTTAELQEAEALVFRLRKKLLPQIEKEISDL